VALALGLQSRGHEAILATGECYRRKIEALGIGFRAVRSDCSWLADPVVMRRLTHPRWVATKVRQEDGVTAACNALESMFPMENPMAKASAFHQDIGNL
jgi:hypothetical protein